MPLALGLAAAAAMPSRAEEVSGANGKSGTFHTLAGGLDAAELARRLAARGMSLGNPILIRIFKVEDELEVWMRKDERFELLATYPVCMWSGTLGPKLSEGDRQSPEGFYSIGRRQLHRAGRWRRSLDLGFPNAFDRAHGRTGSYILVHGGCSSTGCFAMTNPVMEEIFTLTEAALRSGQPEIPVHVFPFRMTPANLAATADSAWHGFWSDLRAAYSLFEETRVPPLVRVCNKRYVVGETGASAACADSDEGQAAGKGPKSAGHPAPPAKAAAKRPTVREAYAAARLARMAAHKRRHAAAHGKSPPR
jgi:murein L,D-transpeptidase YafK